MGSQTETLEAVARRFDPTHDFDAVLAHFGFELLSSRLSGRRTLEMGCSTGLMTGLLASRVGQLEVVDGSAKYLADVERALQKPDVLFHHALFEDFRPDHPFDDVVLARGLEHVPDAVSVLRRIRGWLAPAGRLHVIVPNAWSFHRLLGVEMGLLKDEHELSDRDRMLAHHRVYDPTSLRQHLNEAGFDVAEEAGIILKFLPNAAMSGLSREVMAGLFRLGLRFPERCAEIYALAQPRPR